MDFNLRKDHSTYTLVKNSQELATIKYNAQANSFRINSKERRLFFMEQSGFLQNKIVVKSEYGVEIAENNHQRNQYKGTLHLGNQKFSYKLHTDSINLYDKHKNPVANFSLEKASLLDSYEASALLFSLAWLLNATAAHKASAQYAF